jgi:hypothetical protein
VGGAQCGRPALAQIVEIRLARLDMEASSAVQVSRRTTIRSIGMPTPIFDRIVESIEISPIFSAS